MSRWPTRYFKIQTRSRIDFENTTNFFFPRYKVRKKESVDFEIRGVFPWCFEKYTTEKHPRYKKRPYNVGKKSSWCFQNQCDFEFEFWNMSSIISSTLRFLATTKLRVWVWHV